MSLSLAASICEQFNRARVVKAWHHGACFFVDVVLGAEWEESYLPLIEEQMKKVIERKKPFEELEMSVAGASAFFSAQGQDLLLFQLPRQKNVLVQVLRYGKQAIPLVSSTKDLANGEFFSLLAAREVGRYGQEAIYRIKGILSSQRVKRNELAFHAMQDLTQFVEELKLLKQAEEGWCYLPKGESARNFLIKSWQNALLQESFCFVSTPQGLSEEEARSQLVDLASFLKGEKGRDKIAQLSYVEHDQEIFDYGVLTPQRGFQDLFCIVVTEAKLFEAVISSLQLMRQIPRIFSFKMQAILYASQSSFESLLLQKALASEQYAIEPSASSRVSFELRLVDEDGCSWSGPKLEIMRAKSLPGPWIVVGSLLGSWERFLALAAQKKKGLPFELVEVQIRIFLLHADLQAYADEVREKLEEERLRVQINGQAVSLKERIHDAAREGIPYIVVIGPKEKEGKTISWRTLDSEEEKTTSVDEFVNKVKN